MPYFLVSLILVTGLEKVSILKWSWDPPPSYIRVPVGILWPIWGLLLLMYAVIGKVNKPGQ